MPITYTEGIAYFEGLVGIEEVDTLMELIQHQKEVFIDLTHCTHMHTAIIQILMVARCPIKAWPTNAQLTMWLKTALENFTKEGGKG